MDLKLDIFVPVLKRIICRVESLRSIKRFQKTGIEGWFKVEIVAALDTRIQSLNNKGPDILFDDNTELEIKAATDFNKSYFINDPIQKYGCPCLFLGDGTKRSILEEKLDENIGIVAYEIISDGENDWLLGLVKKKGASP